MWGLLGPCAVKVACTVPRGRRRSNAPSLPGPGAAMHRGYPATARPAGFPLVAWRHRLKGEMAMAETRRKFEQDFKEGAVRLVRETGKPIAQVARELGIHDATLGTWVNAERRRRGEGNSGLRYQVELHAMTGRVVTCPVDEMNQPRGSKDAKLRIPPSQA